MLLPAALFFSFARTKAKQRLVSKVNIKKEIQQEEEVYRSACGFGKIGFAAIISQTETNSFAYGLHLPTRRFRFSVTLSLLYQWNPFQRNQLHFPFPRRRETSELRADELSAVVTALTWGPFVTQFQPENKALYSGTSLPLARASSPCDGETDGFPASSRLVCLFVSFPICPFHRVAAAAAIRLCFIHDWLWRLRSSLCDRG